MSMKASTDRFQEDFRKVESIERSIRSNLADRQAALSSNDSTARV